MDNYIKTIINGLKAWTQNAVGSLRETVNKLKATISESISKLEEKVAEHSADIIQLQEYEGETYQIANNAQVAADNAQVAADNAQVAADNNLFTLMTPGCIWTVSDIKNLYLKVIYYANGLWVGGTSGNGLCYSTDGITWMRSNLTEGTASAIYYANGIWLAACDGAPLIGIYYSKDGMTWTQANPSTGYVNAIYFINGLWIAGNKYNYGYVYYSEDGITWTQINITDRFYMRCVEYNNDLWVMGSTLGPLYSTDGKTWHTGKNIDGDSLVSFDFFSIIYADDIWVGGCLCGSSKSSPLWYSKDGMVWERSNIAVRGGFSCVAYANGTWVASSSYSGLYYSTDGITWKQSSYAIGTGFDTVQCINSLWLATISGNYIGSAAPRAGIYYSTDGKKWALSNTSPIPYFLVNEGTCLVALPYGSTGEIYYTKDGMRWEMTNAVDVSFRCVAYANEMLVADSNTKGLYYSTRKMAYLTEIPTDDHINSLIDAKLAELGLT